MAAIVCLSAEWPLLRQPVIMSPLKPLTYASIANAEYKTTWIKGGSVRSTNGQYQSDERSFVIIKLDDQYAFGDLDGDGAVDATAVLIANGGGSGAFVTLEALVNVKSGALA